MADDPAAGALSGRMSTKLLVALAVVRSKPASITLQAFIRQIRVNIQAAKSDTKSQLTSQDKRLTLSLSTAQDAQSHGDRPISSDATLISDQDIARLWEYFKRPHGPKSLSNTPKKRTRNSMDHAGFAVGGQKRARLDTKLAVMGTTGGEVVASRDAFLSGSAGRSPAFQSLALAASPSLDDLKNVATDLCVDAHGLISLLVDDISKHRDVSQGGLVDKEGLGSMSSGSWSSCWRVVLCTLSHLAAAVSHFNAAAVQELLVGKIVYQGVGIFEHLLSATGEAAGHCKTAGRATEPNRTNRIQVNVPSGSHQRRLGQRSSSTGTCWAMAHAFISFYHILSSTGGRTEKSICEGAMVCLLRECTKTLNVLVFDCDENEIHMDMDFRFYTEALTMILESVLTTEKARMTDEHGQGSDEVRDDPWSHGSIAKTDKQQLLKTVERFSTFTSACELGGPAEQPHAENAGLVPTKQQYVSETARLYIGQLARVLHV